jgi:hypothetical protein
MLKRDLESSSKFIEHLLDWGRLSGYRPSPPTQSQARSWDSIFDILGGLERISV